MTRKAAHRKDHRHLRPQNRLGGHQDPDIASGTRIRVARKAVGGVAAVCHGADLSRSGAGLQGENRVSLCGPAR